MIRVNTNSSSFFADLNSFHLTSSETSTFSVNVGSSGPGPGSLSNFGSDVSPSESSSYIIPGRNLVLSQIPIGVGDLTAYKFVKFRIVETQIGYRNLQILVDTGSGATIRRLGDPPLLEVFSTPSPFDLFVRLRSSSTVTYKWFENNSLRNDFVVWILVGPESLPLIEMVPNGTYWDFSNVPLLFSYVLAYDQPDMEVQGIEIPGSIATQLEFTRLDSEPLDYYKDIVVDGAYRGAPIFIIAVCP